MEEKDLTVIQRIEAEIAKIDNKESNIFFFVLDTKGNPSGSLEYIYKLAMILKENEYNVTMLYQKEENEEFVGVEEWLGTKYSELEHYDIASDEVSVSPSDILFIPESVLRAAKISFLNIIEHQKNSYAFRNKLFLSTFFSSL